MDQLKQAFSVLRKYHFWILCALIVLLYIGTWFMSTSAMTKETDTRAGKIESAFKMGDQIVGISNHPNTQSADMMKRLNRERPTRCDWLGKRVFGNRKTS